MKKLGIMPHLKCNIACEHCCACSGPKATEHLDDNVVLKLVDEAASREDIEEVGFTGGEVMLRPAFLKKCASRLHKAGKRVSIVTNGFWASSENRAAEVLTGLKAAGITKITLSCDGFHQKLLPVEFVRNVLLARHKVNNITFGINMAESLTQTSDEVIKKLGSAAHGVPITKFGVAPVGRAENLPDSDIEYHHNSEDNLRCPGFFLTFYADGKVFPCCSFGIFETTLSLGDAHSLSIAEAAYRIEHNIIFLILAKEGLSWFVDKCRQNDIPGFDSPFPVVDACHLCNVIFRNKSVLPKLHKELIAYKNEHTISNNHLAS